MKLKAGDFFVLGLTAGTIGVFATVMAMSILLDGRQYIVTDKSANTIKYRALSGKTVRTMNFDSLTEPGASYYDHINVGDTLTGAAGMAIGKNNSAYVFGGIAGWRPAVHTINGKALKIKQR